MSFENKQTAVDRLTGRCQLGDGRTRQPKPSIPA